MIVLAAAAVLSAACDSNAWRRPPDSATGVVIAADGPSAAEVDRFTLRTADGQSLEFTVGRLDLTNGGLPSAHLREHMVSGEPITVYYYGTEIIRYTDAIQPTAEPTLAPTASPAPTRQPTATASPELSAQPTQALPFRLDIEPFADGFQALTFVTNAADGTGWLYAVEQRGVIGASPPTARRIGRHSSISPTASARAVSVACSGWPSTPISIRRTTAVSSSTTPTPTATRSSPSSMSTGRPGECRSPRTSC